MGDIRFGSDGWRGGIAEDYTFDNVRRVTQAVADYFREDTGKGSQGVVIGYDRRFASEHFAGAVAEVLAGTSTYGTLHVSPYLTIGGDVTSLLQGPQPVKTVPAHFSTVNLASDQDIELVFGKEDKERFRVWRNNAISSGSISS